MVQNPRSQCCNFPTGAFYKSHTASSSIRYISKQHSVYQLIWLKHQECLHPVWTCFGPHTKLKDFVTQKMDWTSIPLGISHWKMMPPKLGKTSRHYAFFLVVGSSRCSNVSFGRDILGRPRPQVMKLFLFRPEIKYFMIYRPNSIYCNYSIHKYIINT